jgi:hypothetical protein
VCRLGKPTHDLAVFHRPLGAHRIRHVLNFGGERLRAGQPEQIADAVLLAERHGLGTGIMTVASDCDARERPAGTDAPYQPAQMSPYLDARGRLARPQHDGDRSAGGAVVDVDRQKAALVMMGVEQGELLVPVHHVTGVVDVQHHALRRLGIAGHPLIDQSIGQADRIADCRGILQT